MALKYYVFLSFLSNVLFSACASSRMLVCLCKRLVPPEIVVCAVRAFIIGLLVSRVRYKLHCCLRTGLNYRVFVIATAYMWLY